MKEKINQTTVREDALDHAEELLAHLQAMLLVTYGGGGESFREMADEFQDNYMWALSAKVAELKACISRASYGELKDAA